MYFIHIRIHMCVNLHIRLFYFIYFPLYSVERTTYINVTYVNAVDKKPVRVEKKCGHFWNKHGKHI